MIASAASTAWADQPGAPNIPESLDRSRDFWDPGPKSELPQPYRAWRGPGRAPPQRAAQDLPPPLTLPIELPRRPLELGAGLAAFLPSCAAGSIDNRGCGTIGPGAGLHATLLYRVGSFFAAGAEGMISGFGGQGHGAFSGAAGDARFLGVVGRVYFAERGVWDPHVALALGYTELGIPSAGVQAGHDGGAGLGGHVSGSVDYLLGSHFRLGPTLGFTHFIAWREQRCAGTLCRAERLPHGRLLGFATLGLHLTGSFGDAL
ncbi:MAG TPA: hypothetical protein VJN18_26620 [Polyangiaceae bacterium]|nr:hypothetical protein [Polyangiaceae bacterium]